MRKREGVLGRENSQCVCHQWVSFGLHLEHRCRKRRSVSLSAIPVVTLEALAPPCSPPRPRRVRRVTSVSSSARALPPMNRESGAKRSLRRATDRRRPIPPEMAAKPPSLRIVGPADYGLRARCVGVLKREHQRRLSARTRLARSIGAAPHGCGSCNRSVGHKLWPSCVTKQQPSTKSYSHTTKREQAARMRERLVCRGDEKVASSAHAAALAAAADVMRVVLHAQKGSGPIARSHRNPTVIGSESWHDRPQLVSRDQPALRHITPTTRVGYSPGRSAQIGNAKTSRLRVSKSLPP